MNQNTNPVQQFKTQIVNVSGCKFEVSANTWDTIRNKVPKQFQHELNYEQTEVFVERHAVSFTAILYYSQGGDLHLPTDVCPATFQRELEFWGIEPTRLSKCCFAKYVSHFDDQEALKVGYILSFDNEKKQLICSFKFNFLELFIMIFTKNVKENVF